MHQHVVVGRRKNRKKLSLPSAHRPPPPFALLCYSFTSLGRYRAAALLLCVHGEEAETARRILCTRFSIALKLSRSKKKFLLTHVTTSTLFKKKISTLQKNK